MNQQPTEVAIAILQQDDKFLMQLRDNIPNIANPGIWGFFGGHLEPGETPEQAVQREVLEEVGYVLPPTLRQFGIYADEKVIRYVFYAPLEVSMEELVLHEGWDMGLISIPEIQQGKAFSRVAGEERPLGVLHRQILLEFISNWYD